MEAVVEVALTAALVVAVAVAVAVVRWSPRVLASRCGGEEATSPICSH